MLLKCFVIFAILLLVESTTPTKLSNFIKLTPLRYRGFYSTSNKIFCSYYLGPSRLEIIENEQYNENYEESNSINELRICDVMPLPFSLCPVAASTNTISPQDVNLCSYQYGFQAGSEICNRDNGLYDNLPYNAWCRDISDCKKQIFNFCNFAMTNSKKEKGMTYSHLFVNYLYSLMNIRISKLIIDVVDQTSEASFQLGAAIILSKLPSATTGSLTNDALTKSIATSSTLTSSPINLNNDINLSSILSSTNPSLDDTFSHCIVNVKIDELINLASDLKIPIYINKSLYQKCCIDAILRKVNIDNNNNKASSDLMIIEGKSVASTPSSKNENSKQKQTNIDNDIRKVWEIYDPKVFMKMNVFEKRKLLRDSGITDLPRPREGDSALNKLLIEYMDSAVREQYSYLLNLEDTNTEKLDDASLVKVFESPRHLLLQQMAEYLENGQTEKAIAMRDEFALLTQLRADPTQSDGSYDRFLDQDDWYMKARRKSMK